MSEKIAVPILTYHGLAQDKGISIDGLYALPKEAFEAQMAYLAEQGFHVVSLKELLAWQTGGALPERSVVVTFDDGLQSDLTVAVPILKRHHAAATFFVNPSTLDREGYLSVEDLKKMRREGMEIGSHGFDHLFLTRLDAADLRVQVEGSKKRLEALLGGAVRFFSVPRGRYNRQILKAAKEAGYEAVCTSDVGFNRRRSDALCLRRWAMKRPYTLEDFVSIVEGRPKGRLRLEAAMKQAAHRLLGHTVYEALRNRIMEKER